MKNIQNLKEFLKYYTKFLLFSLFANFEETAHLKILSHFKLPPSEITKYNPISSNYDLGLDAAIYSRLLETVVLILKEQSD